MFETKQDTETMTDLELREAFQRFQVDVVDLKLRRAFHQYLIDGELATDTEDAELMLNNKIEHAEDGDLEQMELLVSTMDICKDQLNQKKERQRNYSPGNKVILEALEENGRNIGCAFPVFMERAAQDPEIIDEALDYYYRSIAQHVYDDMDEVDEVA